MLIFNVLVSNKKKSGIYKITNLTNGKIYIGSSQSLWKRYLNHKNCLDANTHGNTKLQNSYNKNNKENFVFELIEICPVELLQEREQYYLNTLLKADSDLKYFYKYGYNIAITSKNNILSQETKTKISKALTNNPKICKKNKDSVKNRVVYVYDLNGVYLDSIESVTKACKKYDIKSTSSVVIICQNKTFAYKNTYVFQYENKNNLIGADRLNKFGFKIKNDVNGNLKLIRKRTTFTTKKSKTIYCFNLKGVLINQFNCFADINRHYNKKVGSNILRSINNKNKETVENCYWSFQNDFLVIENKTTYKHSEETKQKLTTLKKGIKTKPEHLKKGYSIEKNYKPVLQYSLEGIFIKEYNSIKDVVKENNYKTDSRISEVCNNKGKTAYGYKWKFKNIG
jgi:hypothetical protein